MTSDTPYRGHIEHDFAMQGIAIHLGRHHPNGGFGAVQPMQLDIVQQPAGTFSQPCLRLTDGMGRALYDALAEHYRTTSGIRMLRDDYLHERDRVDRLIEALIRSEPAGRSATAAVTPQSVISGLTRGSGAGGGR